MFTSLQTRLKKAGRWLPVALLPLLPFAAQAQALNYSAAGATNVAGTYTDLGTTGTAITTANTDDANSAAQPIGFSFNFNGTAFTQFVLNTNGFLKLGATAPSATAMFLPAAGGTNIDPFQSPNPADVNIVAPFNVDLTAGNGTGGAEYRVTTTGTAPNQVCTIQWKNLSDKAGGQFANFSFQVKLYQTTNNVDFTYDAPVASAAAPVFQFSQVGLKGSGFTSGQFVQALKQSSAAWSAATFATAITGTALNTVNYRNNINPVAGTTYRFSPTVGNDATVALIYTQGQLATFSPAHVVRANVSNVGGNAYTGTATLTVTRGATTLFTTTQPVASLAAGASSTVSFAAYDAATMANVGTNTVTVSLGSDDNNANNTKTLDQVVSATTVNYASPATATTGSLSFGATGAGNVGSRFATASPRLVTSIQAYISSGVGTAAGVLFDGTGVELGRSAVRTLATADAGTVVTFTLTTPVNIGAGDFLAGLNLTGGAGLGAQDETPTRAATFYQVNTGPALVDLASNNLGRFNLGAVTGTATSTCLAVTGLTIGSITTTGATATFTGPASGTSYTVTYTPTGGTATTVTPAPTASPVTLSGLMSGTTYTVAVTSNCGAGQTSSTVSTTFSTLAVAPANDLCSAATPLTCGVPVTGTTVGATTTGDPTTACSVGSPLLPSVSPGVFYSFAGNGQVATVSTCSGPTATTGDTKVFVYSGSCGTLTCVGSSDDFAGCGTNATSSSVTFPTVTGTNYYIFVQYFQTAAGPTVTGPFGLSLTCTAPVVTTYATLPVSESFEGTWLNGQGTRDLPSASWRNTPATGVNSWRRDDDGASAGWSFATSGGYTPASSQGARSARFHSYGALAGQLGSLDLYVNMSGPGSKTLTFDYINPTSSATNPPDKLDVLVSTDGGATFSTTPVLTATNNATFTAKTVVIASTSATTVIRFQALADFGNDDIGIDNVQLRVITATQNAALAATVSLYPNPAHQSFQLSVPAGSLRNASASLTNALGQVVQSRELNLPAAGGIVPFDVSRLAAGVYSLTLKSGNDLVVKRVVVE